MTETAAMLAALQAIAEGSFYRLSGHMLVSAYAMDELAKLGYRRVWRNDGTQWAWVKGEPNAVKSAV